jgi:membrane-bound serine protease (ClpP class)
MQPQRTYRTLSYVAKLFCSFITSLFFLSLACSAQKVISISINGGINPASAEFIQQSIYKARDQKAECLIINLNTPGGLLTSTRAIVSDILKAPLPVIVFVSPTGAHAGSAGVFITMAAHVAAMAPGTNIGAAHPVTIQGKSDAVMNEKGTNDAAAFIKSIATQRNRNSEWGERAVRYSVAITEKEALENNVIDVIANTEADLLQLLDGKRLQLETENKILHTKNASIHIIKMGFFLKVLDLISNPNIVYLLMMLGFFGILFELMAPGTLFPGIAGVIFLIFAFYSLSSMPVNYAGVALILFGIVLYLLEIKIISHGLLGIGGTVSVLLGSLFLFRNSPTENILSLSWSVIIATTAVTALFFLFIVGMGLKAQKAKPALGANVLIGKKAVSLTELDPSGQVAVMGEIWNATAVSERIKKGEEVIIKNVKDLTLYVERTTANELL